MRILATTALLAAMFIIAPVLADMRVKPQHVAAQNIRETVIAKTSPDGTWPFELPESKTVLSYSI